MRRFRPAVVLVGVALVAALFAHVVIDVLGDYLLAHDTYDDVDHSSRGIVALVTLSIALAGAAYGLRAAIREANGSENALCLALRSTLPHNLPAFVIGAVAASTVVLGVMECCDSIIAGEHVEDLGDLFGGSIAFGGTILAVIATGVSLCVVGALRRLAQLRLVAAIVVEFLRRSTAKIARYRTGRDVAPRLVVAARHIRRRIAGRAPPLPLRVAIQ